METRMSRDPDIDDLVGQIRPLAEQLTALKAQMKSLGQFTADPVNTLWHAFELTAHGKRKTSTPHRFADLVSLVRFALEQQPVLKPFAESVNERFEQWLDQRRADFQVRSTPPTPSTLHPETHSAGLLSGPSSPSTVPPAADSEVRAPFTPEQLAWLKLIRDHIATSLSIELDDLDYTPFNQEGGLGKAHQLFRDQLPQLLEELNEALAA